MIVTLAGLTGKESALLAVMAQTALAELGVQTTLGRDALRADDGRVFGLENLASMCHTTAPAGWRDTIFDHFKALLDKYGSEPPALTKEQIWNGIHLRVAHVSSVISVLGMESLCSYSYTESLADGELLALLVHVDGPYVRWLRNDDLVGLDVGALQELARVRLRAVEYTESRVPGTKVTALRGESGFVASQILRLPEVLVEGESLVSIPTRHEMAVAPATRTGLDELSEYTDLARRNGLAPLHPTVWHWDGELLSRAHGKEGMA